MNIELMHGDCLEEMSDISDHSVDMVLCDLPYGTTACRWDVIIPFAQLWEHYWRVLKPNGAVVLFGSEPFSSSLRMSQINCFKYDWIWEKERGTGHLNAKVSPLKSHETVSVFGKSKVNYYPQGLIKGTFNNNRPAKSVKTSDCYGSEKNIEVSSYSNYPLTILKFKRDNYGDNNKHPTQKPVSLLEYLIKTYTNEGETVLDNTMGSGSTGVACINTNRNFIGIEMDDKYFDIAKKRISEARGEV